MEFCYMIFLKLRAVKCPNRSRTPKEDLMKKYTCFKLFTYTLYHVFIFIFIHFFHSFRNNINLQIFSGHSYRIYAPPQLSNAFHPISFQRSYQIHNTLTILFCACHPATCQSTPLLQTLTPSVL